MPRKLARSAFLIIAVLSVLLAYFLKDLRFNYVFEDFFPVDDPDMAYYEEFRGMFGDDNDYLLIGIVNDPTIFDTTFLKRIENFTKDASSITHITEVASITDIKQPVISPAGFFQIPVIHPDNIKKLKSDSSRIFKHGVYVESLLSPDARSLAIFLKHEKLKTKEAADSLVNAVQSLLMDYSFKSTHMAGKVYAQGVFVKKMQVELIVFLSASVLLVIVFLAFAYRTWWAVLIPLIIVMLATVWILGLMGMMDKRLDILMVLLPTIMFVVGMSDVVHIMTKYIEQLRLGASKITAIKVTFKEVGLATFLTSLTTSIGFLTLFTASIRPIQEFGLYTAIGVFFAFIVAFLLLPSCLLFLPKPKVSKKLINRSVWFGWLSTSFLAVLKNGKLVIASTIIITGIAVYGITLIVINTYLIEDLPKNDPLKQDFLFFDQNFGGSRPFELTATVNNDRTVFDKDVILEIDKVEQYLINDIQVGNVVSPTTIIKSLNQAVNGGRIDQFKLPEEEPSWKKVNKYLSRFTKQQPTQKIISQDKKIARISGRVGDIGSKISLEKTEDLKAFIEKNTNPNVVKFKVTGTSNLIDKNNEYLSRNMFEGLAIAFGVVALIAGILFKSARMVLITLIPNIIPLLLVAGIMGIFGITLKLSTSIIFTIAFGIAVDDTLHFISKLKIELNKGKSLIYALKRTYLSTGKAIIVTSLILSGGFLTLLLSSFGGTFYTGLLVSMTLVFAVLFDLTLLPVLVLYFFRKNIFKRKSLS